MSSTLDAPYTWGQMRGGLRDGTTTACPRGYSKHTLLYRALQELVAPISVICSLIGGYNCDPSPGRAARPLTQPAEVQQASWGGGMHSTWPP